MRWDWYEIWLPHATIFLQAVKVAAEQLRVPLHEVSSTASEGLFAAYREARPRVVFRSELLPAARRPLKIRKR